ARYHRLLLDRKAVPLREAPDFGQPVVVARVVLAKAFQASKDAVDTVFADEVAWQHFRAVQTLELQRGSCSAISQQELSRAMVATVLKTTVRKT
ncbi:MAG: hypothetical protein GY772_08885, partial [bacterium]|nr:hypothetical protein [bacterium]